MSDWFKRTYPWSAIIIVSVLILFEGIACFVREVPVITPIVLLIGLSGIAYGLIGYSRLQG